MHEELRRNGNHGGTCHELNSHFYFSTNRQFLCVCCSTYFRECAQLIDDFAVSAFRHEIVRPSQCCTDPNLTTKEVLC